MHLFYDFYAKFVDIQQLKQRLTRKIVLLL
jgi:hypothetical protein